MAVKMVMPKSSQNSRPQMPPQRGVVSHARPSAAQAYQRAPQRSSGPVPQQPPSRKGGIPIKKRKRREREYFFIMRRGVCFAILLLALLWIGVLALNYLNIMPNYTSFLTEKDLTPLDERLEIDTEELDDDGNAITLPYEDKSVYISFMDPIYGAITNVFNKPMVDEEGLSLSPFYDEMYEKIMGPQEEEIDAEAADETNLEDEEGDEDLDLTEELAREEDSMLMVAKIAFPYFPLGIALSAVAAILLLLISLFSLFGRRIFKGFLLFSIIILLAGVLTFVAGFAASGTFSGNPQYLEDGTLVSIIDFSKIGDFLMGSFTSAPETAIDPEIDIPPLPMVAGVGTLILLILPLLMTLLSFFAKRKVPYSIFDR